MNEQLLSVRDLRVRFRLEDGLVSAVDRVSFNLRSGRTLGLVGESGCGKSVTSLAVMKLIPNPPGLVEAGALTFKGADLLGKSEKEMRRIRGNEISMIFQEPMTSLNPVFPVGDQIAESIMLHQHLKRAEARERTVQLLRKVGIPSPEKRAVDYPHQLSGGMRQRVMIAMALACHPSLLIADEPTTALDVTIQAQILELMRELRDELGMAIMLVTHDMGVIAEMADEVAVMYAGQIVEYADVQTLFASPGHPYSAGLLNSIPKLHRRAVRLSAIDGVVPSPREMPSGCRFHTRCRLRRPQCAAEEPPLQTMGDNHQVACWRPMECQGSQD